MAMGMDGEALADAMVIGKRRNYSDSDLGHFGLGLKAASLGQANSLTMFSRSRNSVACGRRWLAEKAQKGFECELVSQASADHMLARNWANLKLDHGTIVRWDEVRSFPRPRGRDAAEQFLDVTVGRLQAHIGLVFHRLIERGVVRIGIDVEDVATDRVGPPYAVEPIDPFSYHRPGRPDYPRTLPIQVGRLVVQAKCHIWPPRSSLPGFKLHGASVLQHQGFYFYRRDRLLQTGGWNNLLHPQRHLQLARIAVDVDDCVARHFSMNPEKTNVRCDDYFLKAVESAKLGRFCFDSYVTDATEAFRHSQRRARTRPKALPPGRGFSPPVRRALKDQFEIPSSEAPIDIRWVVFDHDGFFEVDREQRVISLNRKYRHAVIGDRDSSLNDAPLLKAVLFLLLADLFRGSYMGARDRAQHDQWDAVLWAAAEAELQ